MSGSEIAQAYVTLLPSARGIGSAIQKEISGDVVKAGKVSGEKMATSMRSSMADHAKKIIAPVLGVVAAAKVKDFLGDSIAEARDSQKVGALTTQVIKSTGKAAHVTAKQVGDLATAISNKTGIDDETIQSGENMLLTFKNIRNEAGKGNKIFDQTARILTDVSSAMGTEPRQAAIQLGKALNDPVKGMTALTRVGVTFTDKQKAVNKALVEGGIINAINAYNGAVGTAAVSATSFAKVQKDNNLTFDETVRKLTGPMNAAQQQYFKHLQEGNHTAEAQKTILKELNSEFGGAAAAQATWGEKASVAWSNFKEGIGTALLPVIDTVEKQFVRKGIPMLNHFSDWFAKDGIHKIERFEKKAVPFIDGVLTDARDILKDAEPYAKGFVNAFNSLPDGVKKGLGAAAVLGVGGKKLGLFNLLGSPKGKGGLGGAGGSGLLGLVSKAKPVPVIIVKDLSDGSGHGPGGIPIPGPDGKPKPPSIPNRLGKFAGEALITGAIVKNGNAMLERAFSSLPGGKLDAHKAIANLKVSNAGRLIERNIHIPGLGGTAGYNAAQDVKNLDTAMADLVKSGNVGKARTAFAALTDEAKKQGVSVKDLKEAFPEYLQSLKWNTDESKKAAAAAKNLTSEVFGTGRQLVLSGMSAKDYKAKLQDLPKQVRTEVLTPGAVSSKADVMALKRQFDLTPRQVKTLMQVLGLDKAESGAWRLKSIYDGLDGRVVRTTIEQHLNKVDTGGRSPAGPRALGGQVLPGRYYRVNETGEELFAPNVPGRIISTRDTRRLTTDGQQAGPLIGTLVVPAQPGAGRDDVHNVISSVVYHVDLAARSGRWS